jgi:formylmethanofuran dehydrogenase subunit E-like metal-binding protein
MLVLNERRTISGVTVAALAMAFLLGCGRETADERASIPLNAAAYSTTWGAVGSMGAEKAIAMLREAGGEPVRGRLIALTNAGYAEIGGEATLEALDGLASVTGATRGRKTLVEIASAPWDVLWFAAYDTASGQCSYLEVDPAAAEAVEPGTETLPPGLFARPKAARIDSGHLFANPEEGKEIFAKKVFGGNEFRVITVANAVAADAPASVMRALELHDHYCPGVTSGVMIAEYVKKKLPPGRGKYFVHTVDPWCKEDALIVLLNATPGKKRYAVCYPSEEDKKARIPAAKGAATIVYRRNPETGQWRGTVLGFRWSEEELPSTGSTYLDKLRKDMWYLERLGRPEEFVTVIKEFTLPAGVEPQDLARPGRDVLVELGLKSAGE